MQVRLVVTDIDDCAYSSISPRDEDKLSQPIIDRAKSGGYSGIYGCTHRSYLNLELCKIEAIRVAATQGPVHDFDAILNHFPTYLVMTRLAKITNLPILAVSMHDDILHDTCGVTYDNIVRPLEESEEHQEHTQKFLSYKETYSNWHTKNPQLIQIAQHARALYPDATEIILDYFDDKRNLCEEATKVMQEPAWPEGVRLNAFNYDYINREIIAVLPEPTSELQANSVFSGDKVEAAAAATKQEMNNTPGIKQ